MKIIVGLGNPGVQYEKTRHNAGFLVLEYLATKTALNPAEGDANFSLSKKLKARIYDTIYKAEKIILVKPDTFMNASGLAVSLVMQYYKAEIDDLLVISDDIDIPLGESRVRICGGSAGQKGLQNIIDVLGSDQFKRIRVGINEQSHSTEHDNLPSKIDTADYVLQKFSDREMPVIEKSVEIVAEFILNWLSQKSELQATTLKA